MQSHDKSGQMNIYLASLVHPKPTLLFWETWAFKLGSQTSNSLPMEEEVVNMGKIVNDNKHMFAFLKF